MLFCLFCGTVWAVLGASSALPGLVPAAPSCRSSLSRPTRGRFLSPSVSSLRNSDSGCHHFARHRRRPPRSRTGPRQSLGGFLRSSWRPGNAGGSTQRSSRRSASLLHERAACLVPAWVTRRATKKCHVVTRLTGFGFDQPVTIQAEPSACSDRPRDFELFRWVSHRTPPFKAVRRRSAPNRSNCNA